MKLHAPSAIVRPIEEKVEQVLRGKMGTRVTARWRYRVDGGSGEHDVILRWSPASGEIGVFADGAVVFRGQRAGAGVFDFGWITIEGDDNDEEGGEGEARRSPRTLRVVASRKPPLRAPPDFRCQDLFIDGRPFFEHPLSTVKEASASSGGPGGEEEEFRPEYWSTRVAPGAAPCPRSIAGVLYPDGPPELLGDFHALPRAGRVGHGVEEGSEVEFANEEEVSEDPFAI